ncbi:MAG: T9SS C-terminal target domain-containing protein [Calditrichaeota bacterium]|nr:MAG: T9SS C-terminal target domain-containing protein [Calditrichota bacterium]MBL1207403.1 T9SS C-terminal target domain-containing protein [Calditrichota bacterium]NOG47235.1 T9SS type A sorting domain-containing protein [Calditrichota bacterium]
MKKVLFLLIGFFLQNSIAQIDTVWTKTHSFKSGTNGYSVKATKDGGFLVIGDIEISNDSNKILLLKTNERGDSLWSKVYGNENSQFWHFPELKFDLIENQDRSIVFTGAQYSEQNIKPYLVKLDSLGNLIWDKTYTMKGYANSITKITDTDYLFSGSYFNYDESEVGFICRINENGDTLWTRKFDFSISDILVSVNDSILAVGLTKILKLNKSGKIIWIQDYSELMESSNERRGFNSIVETSNYEFITTGIDFQFGVHSGFIFKITGKGDSLNFQNGFAGGHDIVWSDDNSIFIGNHFGLESGPNGEIYSVQNDTTFSFFLGTFVLLRSINKITETEFVITGSHEAEKNSLFISKVIHNPVTKTNLIKPNLVKSFNLFQNYPNPFNPTTTISYQLKTKSNVQLTIYDISGREVKTLVNKRQTAGQHSVDFDASGLSSGIYFYRLSTSSGFVQNRKMVVLK